MPPPSRREAYPARNAKGSLSEGAGAAIAATEGVNTRGKLWKHVSPILTAQNLNLWYGDFKALKDISLDVGEREITALIGPSGCGKSTFLKTLNRMNDLVPGCAASRVMSA